MTRLFTRSLRNRLAGLFGLIVLGAIGIVYLATVPQLAGRLTDQKLDGLRSAAEANVAPLRNTVGARLRQEVVRERLRRAADLAGARVTLLDVATGTQGQRLTVGEDTGTDAGAADLNFVFAEEAARSGETVQGTEPTGRGRVAVVAIPLYDGSDLAKVAAFSDDLEDVNANVALIQRRVLLGGLIGLALAMIAGYVVAFGLSARVRRLERAAHRVAGGDFSSRIRVTSDDELGRLAAAFADMQNQLAELQTAREQFIATASHELRTPVFSLGGFLELLDEEEDLDEETRAAFRAQVRGQVERLRKLTTELLDLSRLGAGSVQIRYETTDVGQLARDVADEFAPRAARLDVALPDPAIEVECDPERVAQVLRILMDNAVVHNPPDTPIRVSAARVNGSVRLAVTDSGQGIKRKIMPHIFEPFFTSDDTQGAGLGLAIAHELAARMHGSLDVASRPGKTTFTLVLPA